MNSRLYTIAEYAQLKGTSKQAVYKAVESGKLKTVEQITGNRRIKYIVIQQDIQEVESDNGKETASINSSIQPERQPTEQQKEQHEQPELNKVEYLALKEQVELQKQQIKELQNKLDERERTIQEYALEFARLADRALDTANRSLDTAGRSQYLQAVNSQGTKKITAEPEPEREQITGKNSLFQIMKSWINTKR